jgi:hypothetical protein
MDTAVAPTVTRKKIGESKLILSRPKSKQVKLQSAGNMGSASN